MGVIVNLKNVRTIFVNVFEKAKDSVAPDGKAIPGKFQFTPVLAKKDPQIRMLESKILDYLSGPDGLKSEEAAEKWMSKNFGFGNHSDKCAVRDLAERDKPLEGEGLDAGLYFKASSFKPIKVQTSLGETQIDPEKSRLSSGDKSFPRGLTIDGDDIEGREVYSGCVSNVSVEFYWHKDFKNLCCAARGIRFKDDGEAFGGAGFGGTATDDDLGDDDDAPKSKRRNRDDEDEKPTRSRRSRDEDDEDDEDERPRRRRRRNRDED